MPIPLPLVIAALTAASALPVPPTDPRESLDELVRAAERRGLAIGLVAVDVESGTRLAWHRPLQPLLPASNQKLLTVAAFLHRLGPEHRFRTGFEVVDGDLRVHAGGDPNWIPGGPLDPAATFAAVAARLRAAGVDQLGRLRLVRNGFDGPTRPDGWPGDQLHRTYCAPTDGLVLDQGCWRVRLAVGDDPQHAALDVVTPLAGLEVRGTIDLTEDRKRGGIYRVDRRGSVLDVGGHLWRKAAPRDVRGALDEPQPAFFLSLVTALRRAGVGFRDAPLAAGGSVPRFDVESPLAPALARCLGESSNFDAEQLLRVLGAVERGDGSFAGGRAAVRAALADLCGAVPDGVAIADGSGLSRGDRVTAAFVVEVLRAAARQPWAAAFRDALPRGGEAGTTLARRFRGRPVGARVVAKTGTIRGVSALSGYVDRPDGRRIAFAILMNWDRLAPGTGPRELQERIVAILGAA